MKKLLLSCLVALLALLPQNVSAVIREGSCGVNIRYSIDTQTHTLVLSGTGHLINVSGSYMQDIELSLTSSFVPNINVSSIEIQDGITSIGPEAFAGFGNLTSVSIPESVTSIGYSAFSGCSSLTTINIPESVTSIGDYAFYRCSRLTSINLPESVTSIGSYAFCECSGLTSIDIKGHTSIGDYAFSECSSLTSITIPEGVTSIGNVAFSGCKSLTSINIPESVTSIGSYAFSGCSNLTSITINSDFTGIGQYAFAGCSNLTSINIPNGIARIDENTFYGCSNINYTEYDGIKYLGFYLVEVIDKTKTTYSIRHNTKYIGYNAFKDCTKLTSITIPPKVVRIDDKAFANCTALSSINIPESVEEVGNDVFNNCNSLPIVDGMRYADTYLVKAVSVARNCAIRKGTRFIGSSAFEEVGISSVNIPESVTSIGEWAFRYCSSLTSINIPENVTNIGNYAFYNCSSLTSITIPESVTSIGNGAFYHCSKITSCNMPSVREIGSGAFSDCTKLASMSLSDQLQSIGKNAFLGTALTDFSVPTSVDAIGEGAFPEGIILRFKGIEQLCNLQCNGLSKCHLYLGNNEIIDLVIPEGIEKVGNAFAESPFISSITIPESVESVYNLGKMPSKLNKVTINSPGIIGKKYEVYAGSSIPKEGNMVLTFGNSVREYVLGDKITAVGNYAFINCELESINVPKQLEYIGSKAFAAFFQLDKLEYPNVEMMCKIRGGSGLLSHVNHLFIDGKEVTDVVIPEGVTSIANSAFGGSCIKSITFPSSIISMNKSAFYNCENLDRAEFASIESLCSIQFEHLSHPLYSAQHLYIDGKEVTDVVIPKGVTSIGDYAFDGCSSLTSITIPSTVTSIGWYALNCPNLTNVYNYATTPQNLGTNSYVFSTYGTLHVQQGCGDAYRAANIWKKFTIVEDLVPDIDPELLSGKCGTSINYAFDLATGKLVISGTGAMTNFSTIESIPWYSYRGLIKTIEIQDGVTSIGNYAFYDCFKLTSITIPESVKRIGDYAFSSCSSLTSINIPEGVTSIGEGAFSWCDLTKAEFASIESLCSINFNGSNSNPLQFAHHLYIDGKEVTEVVIPEGVTRIGSYTFSSCSSLTSINIPESVTNIGTDAFYNCSSLTSINIPEGVTSIGLFAFENCSSLTSINIPESVTSIKYGTFSYCSSLTSITIPEGVTSIGPDAFRGCSSLTSITIPEGVTSIGSDAFRGCSSLTSVVSYAKVPPTCGSDAFKSVPSNATMTVYKSSADVYKTADGWKDFTILTMPDKIGGNINRSIKWELTEDGVLIISGTGEMNYSSSYAPWYSYRSSIKSVEIKDGVTSIGRSAFSNCSSLTSITIPEGVTSIGDDAFSYCTSLTSINIPKSITNISDYAFYGCYSLTSINIPEGVTSIGKAAFYDCWSLTSINIPEGVTSISDFAFCFCSSLTSINIPKGVTSIGSTAFQDCSSLTSITIPEGVTSIGEYAFNGCSSLTSINIPESVTTIGKNAFFGCTGIAPIDGCIYVGPCLVKYVGTKPYCVINENVKYVMDDAFFLAPRDLYYLSPVPQGKPMESHYTIHVLPGCLEEYKKWWPTFNIVDDAEQALPKYVYNTESGSFLEMGDANGTTLTTGSYGSPFSIEKDKEGNTVYTPLYAESGVTSKEIESLMQKDENWMVVNSLDKNVIVNNKFRKDCEALGVTSYPYYGTKTDCTSKIGDASLKNGYAAWTFTPSRTGTQLKSNDKGLEIANGSGILSQQIKNLAPGIYEVKVEGLYRNGSINAIYNQNKHYDQISTAYLKANGNSSLLNAVSLNMEEIPAEPATISEPKASFKYFADTLFFANHCQMTNGVRATNIKTATLATPAYYKPLDVNSAEAEPYLKEYKDTPEDKALFLDVYSWHNYRNAKKSSRDAEPMIADKPMFMPLTFEELKKVDEAKGQTTYQDKVLKYWEDGLKINPNDVLKYEQYLKDYAEWQANMDAIDADLSENKVESTVFAEVGADGILTIELVSPNYVSNNVLYLSDVKLGYLGESTDIEDIDATISDITSDAPIYDLSGRKVQNLIPSHIYIQNGKKFIAK